MEGLLMDLRHRSGELGMVCELVASSDSLPAGLSVCNASISALPVVDAGIGLTAILTGSCTNVLFRPNTSIFLAFSVRELFQLHPAAPPEWGRS